MSGADPEGLIGRVLDGRYRVERHLGGGGMGQVYEAIQIDLGRRVALKVLSPELAKEPVYLERFRREAETAACLGNPHIVHVTDLVLPEGGDPPFLIMERLVGESVMDALMRDGPLALDRTVRIMIQLLDALAAAHDAGIIHRDVKPPNVFLVRLAGGDELVKLVDFGVAKLNESAGAKRLTAVGALVGTPRFAAPEQLRGGPIDARTDVYGAGTLLYGMIAGRPPFGGPPDELIRTILAEMPIDLRVTRPEVPPALADAALKAMAKDPRDRFQSAREFAAALGDRSPRPKQEQAASAMPARAAAPHVPPTSAGAPVRQRLLLPLILSVLVSLGLILGLGIVLLTPRPRIEAVKASRASVASAATFADCESYEGVACACDGADAAAICTDARESVARLRAMADTEPASLGDIAGWCRDARMTEDCVLEDPTDDEDSVGTRRVIPILPGLIHGELEASDDVRQQTDAPVDRYSLTLSRGTRIDLTMRSAHVDAYLLFRSPNDDLIAVNDDTERLEDGDAAHISYAVREAGIYVIEATASAAGELGEYELEVLVIDPSTPSGRNREREDRRRSDRDWGVF